MYASLISAGASQLYDLYKSVTDSSRSDSAQKTSFKPPPDDPSSNAADSGASAVTSTGSTSGSSLSDALHKLFVDLQGSTSSGSSADPTSTVAGDLQSVFKDVKSAGGHGHHHAGPPPSDAGASSPTTSTASPFQGLASSLLAYAKTQGLTASASTSLTA